MLPETVQNSLILLGVGASVLICAWLSFRSLPWAISRQLKGWDLRLDQLEGEWHRTSTGLAVSLEALEQLDESVKKHRSKVTQERVRLEQGPGPTPPSGGTLHDLRKRAGMI
ncbi:MAG: hypothetical protein V3T07_01785 [Myxococcota bacterium]